MPLSSYGANPTLQSINQQRNQDMACIAQLEGGKLQGRDRTGIRTTPSAFNDVIEGDMLGDVVNTATNRYTLIKLSGVTLWSRIAQSTTF